MKALVGFTGDIGRCLSKSTDWDSFYNSKNIETIKRKTYDLVVIAAPSGDKFKIDGNIEVKNKNEKDLSTLIECINSVTAKRIVLLSSIVVCGTGTEDSSSASKSLPNSPYIESKLVLERSIKASNIIRLPSMFGTTINKNIVYDVLKQEVELNLNNTYQLFPSKKLWSVIEKYEGVPLLHLNSEPISVEELISTLNPERALCFRSSPTREYNCISKYTSAGQYHINKQELKTYLTEYKEEFYARS